MTAETAAPTAAQGGCPTSVSVRGEGGAELSAEAYVEGLDGAERALLLRHIAHAWPDVVEAGVRLVADWRAECAEHRGRQPWTGGGNVGDASVARPDQPGNRPVHSVPGVAAVHRRRMKATASGFRERRISEYRQTR